MNATCHFYRYWCDENGRPYKEAEGYAHVQSTMTHPDAVIVDEVSLVSMDGNLAKQTNARRGDIVCSRAENTALYYEFANWLLTFKTSAMQEALNDARMVA